MSSRRLILVSLFVAMTAIGARISLPLPYVPFTFQTFFVLLAGMLLGSRLGALSQACYVVIGLIGIPIFARGGGPGYVLQPTFGYILGFVPGAALAGLVIEKKAGRALWPYLLASGCGLAAVYFCGLVYLWLATHLFLGKGLGLAETIKVGLVILLPGAVVQGVLSAVLGLEIGKRMEHMAGLTK